MSLFSYFLQNYILKFNIANIKDTKCVKISNCYHPAGDVLWVFVEPGNVVP